jgi:nitroreductase
MLSEAFNEIVERRRSNRKFDTEVQVPEEVITRSLERAMLSPNSSNMQLWEFVWIRSEEVRNKMAPLCMGQNAAKTASDLVAFVTRRDLWREHARWNLEQAFEGKEPGTNEKRNRLMKAYYGKLMPFVYLRDPFGIFSLTRIVGTFAAGLFRPVIRFGGHGDQRVILHKSCALAAQTFMLSVTAEGYDTCPMEGFDRVRVSRLLGLRGDAEICMIVAVGKGTPAGVYGSRKRVPYDKVVRMM